jgi:hypothetical protein
VGYRRARNLRGPRPARRGDGYGNTGAANDFSPDVVPTAEADALEGWIHVDPGYVDVSAADPRDGDLSLSAGSALVDAGDPGERDADGSGADIGAYGGPGGAW